MPIRETNEQRDPQAVALQALVWTLGDADRADRLLATTGLDAGELRSRATDPELLAATLGFLEAHEPDLIACADGLGLSPADIVHARHLLEAR